jgi:small subunit ribosomal protein S5
MKDEKVTKEEEKVAVKEKTEEIVAVEEKKETKAKATENSSPNASKKALKDTSKKVKEKPKFKKNERPRRSRRNPRKDACREFEQKIISIRRVTRVVAGGRRFSFSVAMVIGDGKGKVGVGIGKAGDTALAIEKAIRDAKKSMITVKLTKTKSIRHDVSAKYCASVVSILPAPGKGIVAGSSVRNVLELAGITDITAKIFSRSKNQLNNARATINALKSLK